MKKKLLTTGIICGCLLVISAIILWVTCTLNNFDYLFENFDVFYKEFDFVTMWAVRSLVLAPIFGVLTPVLGLITLTSFILLALIQFEVLTIDLKPVERQQKATNAPIIIDTAISTEYNETVEALKSLERLHNDKFITDEEYEQSRKDLMSKLY